MNSATCTAEVLHDVRERLESFALSDPRDPPALGASVCFPSLTHPGKFARGTLEYLGPLPDLPPDPLGDDPTDRTASTMLWAGVSLPGPSGHCDGSVLLGERSIERVRLFQCAPMCGAVVPASVVVEIESSSPGGPASARHVAETVMAEWRCPMCTFINPPGCLECSMCGSDAAMAGPIGRAILERTDLERTCHPRFGPRPDGEDGTAPGVDDDDDDDDDDEDEHDQDTNDGDEHVNNNNNNNKSHGKESWARGIVVPSLDVAGVIASDMALCTISVAATAGHRLARLPPPVPGIVDPDMVGSWRGVEGASNSCASDALIFSLFAGTDAFDWMLGNGGKPADTLADGGAATVPPALSTLRRIVTQLRRRFFVDARAVVRLRTQLMDAGAMRADSEEKDVEEVLTSITSLVPDKSALISRGLRVLRRGAGEWDGDDPLSTNFLYSIFPTSSMWEGNGGGSGGWACLQDLMMDSLQSSGVWLEDVPEVLAVLLPRSGEGRTFRNIVPSAVLDLDAALVDSARDGRMTLVGVVAIESSHYVSFARLGRDEWVMLDSMADRLNERSNVPRVTRVPGFAGGVSSIEEARRLERTEPLFQRCVRDAYFCVYVRGVDPA